MPHDQIEGCKAGQTEPMRAPFMRAARGAALAALVVCAGAVAARAGDDDTTSSSTSIYDRMLQAFGVEGGANIQYGERSPLVVPPTRDLPPPMADAPPPLPDWPKDPDMTARAKAKAKEKPGPQPDYTIESVRPLRPDELNVPGSRVSGSGGASSADPEAHIQPNNKKSLFSLGMFGNKEEYATFTGEPARTSLTDPPPGYLTPSPDQPYGVGPEHKQNKIPTVADRVTPSAAGN